MTLAAAGRKPWMSPFPKAPGAPKVASAKSKHLLIKNLSTYIHVLIVSLIHVPVTLHLLPSRPSLTHAPPFSDLHHRSPSSLPLWFRLGSAPGGQWQYGHVSLLQQQPRCWEQLRPYPAPTGRPCLGSCNLPDPGGNCLPGLLVTSCPGSPSPIHTSATNSPLISFSAEVPGRVPVTWTRALHPLFYTVRCSPNCTQHSPTGFLSDYRVCSHRILSAFK